VGYPSLLPSSLATHRRSRSNPFWYDGLDPTELWDKHLERAVPTEVVQPLQLIDAASVAALPPKPPGHLRFVSISDTHNYHDRLPLTAELIQAASIDVLVHAGDWSNVGEQADVDAFTAFIRALPVRHKIVIAGNHDVSFDEAQYETSLKRRFRHKQTVDARKAKEDLVAGYPHAQATADNPFPAFAAEGGVAYLEDSGISVQGINIWGSVRRQKIHDQQSTRRRTHRTWSGADAHELLSFLCVFCCDCCVVACSDVVVFPHSPGSPNSTIGASTCRPVLPFVPSGR
jgi:hypothetical protein